MDFEVAAPWWWFPASAGIAVFAGVVAWIRSGSRYTDAPAKRSVARISAIVTVFAIPAIVLALSRTAVLVRGEELQVRRDFEWSFRSYQVRDLAGYNLQERGRAKRAGDPLRTKHWVLVLHFKDGFKAEIHERWVNYDRLQSYLDSREVPVL